MYVCILDFIYLSVMQNRSALAVNTLTVAIRIIYVSLRLFLQDGSSHCFVRNNGLIRERTLFKRDSESCFTDMA
jgi:hypothetical protein